MTRGAGFDDTRAGCAGERWFPLADARSASLTVAITIIVLVETVALHLWLRQHFPVITWTLIALSILSLVWLVDDYQALAGAGLALDAKGITLRVGRRFRVRVSRGIVMDIAPVDWRSLPTAERGYLNAAAPNDPNVVLVLSEASPVRLSLGLRMRVRKIGLRLAEPERLVREWTAPVCLNSTTGGSTSR